MAAEFAAGDQAQFHALLGYRVVPMFEPKATGSAPVCACWKGAECESPGKHPRFSGWIDSATSDMDKVRGWWADAPNANCAALMGNGRLRLDRDDLVGGEESWHALVQEYGDELEDTRTIITGNGLQYEFACPEGVYVKSRTAGQHDLGPGIDIRAERSLGMLPGSLHYSGRRYEWDVVRGADYPLRPLPPALLARLVNGTRQGTPGPAEPLPERVPIGQRHGALVSLAGTLRRRDLDAQDIGVMLSAWNERHCDPPVTETEIAAIAASMDSYEADDPLIELRDVPADVSTRERLVRRAQFYRRSAQRKNKLLGEALGREVTVRTQLDYCRESRSREHAMLRRSDISAQDRITNVQMIALAASALGRGKGVDIGDGRGPAYVRIVLSEPKDTPPDERGYSVAGMAGCSPAIAARGLDAWVARGVFARHERTNWATGRKEILIDIDPGGTPVSAEDHGDQTVLAAQHRSRGYRLPEGEAPKNGHGGARRRCRSHPFAGVVCTAVAVYTCEECGEVLGARRRQEHLVDHGRIDAALAACDAELAPQMLNADGLVQIQFDTTLTTTLQGDVQDERPKTLNVNQGHHTRSPQSPEAGSSAAWHTQMERASLPLGFVNISGELQAAQERVNADTEFQDYLAELRRSGRSRRAEGGET